MSKLSADCLNEIFEYLEDDKITLNSCVLVNRLWCSISVRILWRSVRNNTTLIACLPIESKEILHKNGIIISTLNSKPPLFNYIAFIKTLSIYQIYYIIKIILKNYQSITFQSLDYKKYIIAQEIYKLLMKQISSLRELHFNSYKIIDIPNVTFTSYSGAKDCLKYLSKLSCRSDIYPEFFYQLSKICYNIQTLKIKFDGIVSNGLTDLIFVQQNLKSLNITLSYNCGNLTNIIPLLTKLPDTLIKFNFYGRKHSIPLTFIKNFKNLQELVLSFDYNYAVEDFQKLQYVTFPQLKTLKFEYAYPRHELLIKFLEINGKSLREFYIGSNDNSINTAISKFCPNLRNLFTIFRKDELNTLKNLFKNCQYLESIEIWCGNDYLYEKELFNIITNFSPKNFFELKIYYAIYSKPELLPKDLDDFFSNWKNRIPLNSLSITIFYDPNDTYSEDSENMEIIEKYKKLGVIKNFRIIM